MKPIIFCPFEDHHLLNAIVRKEKYEIGELELRPFPDGETYLKYKTPLKNRDIIFLASLDRPNSKVLPLLFMTETAKELGARRVGLCSPYLAYMRQDKRFHEGEGITSTYFAKLISQYFDWLVTIDPHLHRHQSLDEIYSIPNSTLHANHLIGKWITKNVENPVLIGPDNESEQWVKEIAEIAKAPYIVLDKTRHSDWHVSVSVPLLEEYQTCTPVLVDDIISTSQTMVETIKHLKQLALRKPVCIGVHAVFAGNSYKDLLKTDVDKVITCNCIRHASNQIDISELLCVGIKQNLSKDNVS